MKQNKKLYNFVACFLKPFVKIFFPYEIIGIENVKDLKSGYIICSNHLSNMDPVFYIVSHPNPVHFMAKSELFRNKFLGEFFSCMGAFAVKRGKGDYQAINEAQNVLKNDEILGIFIEGTRSKTGEFLRPKSGAALLAATSNVPIVPACITGDASDKKVHIFKKTVIKYGTPITPGQLGINERTRTEIKSATNLIMEKIKNLREGKKIGN